MKTITNHIPFIKELFIVRTDYTYNEHQGCIVCRVEFCDGSIWEHQKPIREVQQFLKHKGVEKLEIQTTEFKTN